MKVLNIKDGEVDMSIDIEDRQPCWYADLNKPEGKWEVGLKHPMEKDSKCVVKIKESKYTQDQLNYIYSSEFAVCLIESFKLGGSKSVDKMVKGIV